MRVVIQRVSKASVTIDNMLKSKIGKGLMVLVGFEESDTQAENEWISKKY
jgi:D-Tyr-tRNAtyr deacylase